jgi:hypothetical protein
MNRISVLRVLLLGVVLVTLGLAPASAFAIGGHGGGGGSHGGGGFHSGGGFGGGGYHGGYGGGHHGGYGGGYHGGYGGYHGGWGGYRGWYGGPGWGWGGWGFGIGLNFGWPGWGYPYGYGYYPYYSYYPYYPYSYPYNYPPPSAGPADPGAAAYQGGQYQNYQNGQYQNYQRSQYQNAAPASRPDGLAARPSPSSKPVTLYNANYATRPAQSGTASIRNAVNYRPVTDSTQLQSMRPQVQNVVRALRGMPPAARERALDSGRYGNLSAGDLQLVRQAAGLAPR